MEQSLSDTGLARFIEILEKDPGMAKFLEPKTLRSLLQEVQRSRAEIATLLKEYRRLQAVSESQAEALDQMEAGNL